MMAQEVSAVAASVGPFIYVCESNTDEWLAKRKTGIGASEASRVLGSPYSLYLEKRNEIPDEQLVGEWLDWGHKLEGIIVHELGHRIKARTLHIGKMYRSTSEPWMLASIDGLVFSPDGRAVAVVEAKNVGAWNASEWENGAPDKYRFQVMQQMHVMGVTHGYVCALIGGQRFVFERIERDDAWLTAYIKTGRDLWRRIQEGDRPAVDGSNDTVRALKELHPNDNGETVALAGAFIEIDQELVALKAMAKSIDLKTNLLESQIKEAMGDATYGSIANGVTYAWKTHKRADSKDVRKLTRKQNKEAA